MSTIADILLIAAALGATFYCVILSRRLNRFNDLEKGVGGAIATLSRQVEDMTKALKSAQGSAVNSAEKLGDLTGKAEDAARRLELLVAALHDLPTTEPRAVHEKTAPAAQQTRAEIDPPDASSPLFSSRRGNSGAAA